MTEQNNAARDERLERNVVLTMTALCAGGSICFIAAVMISTTAAIIIMLGLLAVAVFAYFYILPRVPAIKEAYQLQRQVTAGELAPVDDVALTPAERQAFAALEETFHRS